MNKMTHGEIWFKKFKDVHMVNGDLVPIDANVEKLQLKKRMSYKKACEYYTQKIRKYFGIEEKIETAEYKKQGFDNVDDYFGYYEAMRYAKVVA